MEGNAVSPFSFRSGRNKVRKVREVSKDPCIFMAHKSIFLDFFFFNAAWKSVFAVLFSVMFFLRTRFSLNLPLCSDQTLIHFLVGNDRFWYTEIVKWEDFNAKGITLVMSFIPESL